MTELVQTKSDRSWLENVTLVFSRISEVKLEAAINDDESVSLARGVCVVCVSPRIAYLL